MDDNKVDHLLEQVVLESLGNYLYLGKLKDKIGLVTQWGAPSWLILQRLMTKGAQSVAQLASARHISESYVHSLVRPLQQAQLISSEDDKLVLTAAGQQALDKLQKMFEHSLHSYAGQFDAAELATTLRVLSKLRELIAEDQSF